MIAYEQHLHAHDERRPQCARQPGDHRVHARVPTVDRMRTTLAPALPLSIPVPLARGVAGAGYPWSWSVYRWLPGDDLASRDLASRDLASRDLASRDLAQGDVDPVAIAQGLASFAAVLRAIDPAGGPPPRGRTTSTAASRWSTDRRRHSGPSPSSGTRSTSVARGRSGRRRSSWRRGRVRGAGSTATCSPATCSSGAAGCRPCRSGGRPDAGLDPLRQPRA